MATIADVAKYANVSMMTVSRVINRRGNVSEATRRKVEDAIDALSYRPNMMAKGLVTGKSRLIAYVMCNLSDPFHGLVSKGIENACFDRNYTVIICDASSEARVKDSIEMLIDRQLDGAIFHHMQITPEQAARLEEADIRCVMIDNEVELKQVSSIDSDNYRGGYMAARHLIEKGHTRIGCIRGSLGSGPYEEYIDTFQRKIWTDRTRGFEDAMREAGLVPIVRCEGSGAMKQGFLLAQGFVREIVALPDPPTALYCENDILALGALSELLELKIDVPGRMAVVGHDGLETCTLLYPRVTTIMQPRYEMGFKAASMLLDRIEHGARVEHRIVNSSLFQGDTT